MSHVHVKEDLETIGLFIVWVCSAKYLTTLFRCW